MISIDFVLKKDKNYYPQVFLQEHTVIAKHYPEISSDKSNKYNQVFE